MSSIVHPVSGRSNQSDSVVSPPAEISAAVTGMSKPALHLTPSSAWHRALWLFLPALLIVLGLYRETVWSMVDIWMRSETFAHGFLIVPMSAWMIWSKRVELAELAPRACVWALPLLAGAGLVWLVAEVSGVIAMGQMAVVAILVLLVWAMLGTAVVRTILFPLLFLFFMVPIGEFLMMPLINQTADFVVLALRLTGIPVFREGNHFSIPSGNWSVVEACSGLRYLIASVTLGCLFAYLSYRTWWRRAAFMLASVLVPIVANWLRAYLIVMIGHLSNNKLATGVDHLVYGWVFFGLVMLLLFWVGSFWREDLQTPEISKRQKTALPIAPLVSWPRLVLVSLVALGIAACWRPALYAVELAGSDVAPVLGVLTEVQAAQAGLRIQPDAFTRWTPHYPNPRALLNQTYMQQAQDDAVAPVGLFIGYYNRQREYGELVTFDNQIVMSADKYWTIVAQAEHTLDTAAIRQVEEVQVRGRSERILVWRWYWIGGRYTDSEYVAKAMIALNMLTGRGDDSAVVMVYTPVDEYRPDAARARLKNFVSAVFPWVETRLASASKPKPE